jgi:hypothetical protein
VIFEPAPAFCKHWWCGNTSPGSCRHTLLNNMPKNCFGNDDTLKMLRLFSFKMRFNWLQIWNIQYCNIFFFFKFRRLLYCRTEKPRVYLRLWLRANLSGSITTFVQLQRRYLHTTNTRRVSGLKIPSQAHLSHMRNAWTRCGLSSAFFPLMFSLLLNRGGRCPCVGWEMFYSLAFGTQLLLLYPLDMLTDKLSPNSRMRSMAHMYF